MERSGALEGLTAGLGLDAAAPGDGRTPVRPRAVGAVSGCALGQPAGTGIAASEAGGIAWRSLAFWIALLSLLAGCTPAGPRALLEGKRLLEQGRPKQAVEELKTATATALLKTNAVAWNYLGLACHYSGQAEEAHRAYQHALQCNRDLTEAHYNLGCLWLEQNNLEAARSELTTCTLRRGNWVEALVELGVAQLRLRDPAGAERSFSQALRLSPQNAEALNGLGLVRAQRGHPSDAAAFFASALKAQPHYGPALLDLAIVSHQYLRDRQFASQKYHEYLALKPAPPNAEAVGAVSRQLDEELNPAAARAPANSLAETNNPPPPPRVAHTNAGPNAARALTPPSPAPSTNVARAAAIPAPKPGPASTGAAPSSATAERASRTPEPAPRPARDLPPIATAAIPKAPAPSGRAAARRYAYLSPRKPAPGDRAQALRAFEQGLQAQAADRPAEAVQAYTLAARLDPAFFAAQYNLGLAATEARNWPAALAAYEHALAIDPRSADARYNFALVLKQANYLADAVNELDKLLGAHPADARAHLALANLYAQQLRQPAKARQHYLRVLRLEPGLSQADAIRDWLSANPE